MEITHDVTIDLLRPRQNVIRVVQEDSTRTIRLKLLSNNQNYNVADDLDEGETLLKFVEFRKSDGHGGIYDTTSTGETAVELEDSSVPNVWLVNLDGQCFTAPGWTQINVRFETESGKRIHTFAIMVDVEPTASSDTESTDWGELNSIADLRNAVSAMFEETMSVEAKQALLNLLARVAYVDEHGQDYYDALEAELFRTADIVSISAVFDQADAVILDTDDLDTLKQYLTVTATYEDLSTREIIGYTLSGTLTVGTSTITVSYGGKTATFTVTVKHNYADTNLANWLRSTSGTIGYADGILSLKCNNQTDITNYSVYVADRAKTLWDDVKNKTLKFRLKVRGNNYGEMSSTNRVLWGVSIYKNSGVTTLGGDNRPKWKNFTNFAPSNSETWYEATLECTLANITSGTGTPTSSSTFGFSVYNQSLKQIDVLGAEIYEVDAE